MWGLFKSKFLSNLISNLILQFNSRFIPGTDVAYKVFDHELNVAAKNFADFLMTKQVKKNPVAFWSTPFYNGHIIASREIIAGNYMGSDNLVQLADTVGYSINLGYAAILDNLPVNMAASGNLQLSVVQKFTHLKPLNSIKAGLSEPFKNMLVPYLRMETRRPLEEALSLESQSKVLSPEELKKRLDVSIGDFTKDLGVGESLVVQTSLSPNGFFKISKSLGTNIEAYARLNDELVDISRTQILHKDAKTVHIYVDPATYNTLALAIGLSVGIPIIELGGSWETGVAKTNYFSINIDTDLQRNPKLFDQLRILVGALKGGSLNLMKSQQKPWVIQHDFYDDNFRFRFLFWRYLSDNFEDRINVTHPSGASANFVRKALGKRSGDDYESLVLDVFNFLLSDLTQTGIQVGSSNSGNPGDTIYGKAVSRQTVGETELDPRGRFGQSLNPLENTFLSVNYHWKGWEMNRARLLKTAKEINKQFGSEIIQDGQLNDIEKLQFYNIYVQVALYSPAIQTMLSHTDSEIQELFKEHALHVPVSPNRNNPGEVNNTWANSAIRMIHRVRKQLAQPSEQIDYRKMIGSLTELVDLCESQLDNSGFLYLVGGADNIFVNGSIVGFRKGSENGNQPLQMQTLGKIGAAAPQGPLQKLQSNMEISGGEFYINWIINGF
jgi:hypothetical protein